MKLATDVIVQRPVPEVFAYFADLERAPEWAAPVVQRRKLTDGPVGVGTVYDAIDRFPGRDLRFRVEVTAFEPDRLMAARMGEPMSGSWEARFTEAPGGTRMSLRAEMNPPGPPFLTSLLRGWAKRAIHKDLERMKARLEAGRQAV